MTNTRQYRIREVVELLDTPATTLRYWEKEFGLSTVRQNGQRRYSDADIDTLRIIKSLLHERGLTTEAAKAYLADSARHRRVRCESIKGAISLLNQLRIPLADSPKGLQIVDAVVGLLSKNDPQNTTSKPLKNQVDLV